ncbi:MAG: YIP1 family protein [Solidesulfovibrio sp.]
MMRITCPQCGFFRELPDNKIPVTSTMATCPKCRHRFKFGPDLTASPNPNISEHGHGVTGEDTGSSWRRQNAAARNTTPPAPAAHWEPEESFAPQPRPKPSDVDAYDPPLAPSSPDPMPEEDDVVAWPPERFTKPEVLFEPESERTPDATLEPPTAPERPIDFTPKETPAASRHARDHRAVARKLPLIPEDDDTAIAPTPPAPSSAPSVSPTTPDTPVAPTQTHHATPAAPEADRPETPPEQGDEPKLRSDGVRDIWARLQAMDEEPAHKHATEHPKPEKEHTPEREAVTDPVPWERLDAYGFLPGLFLTLKKILFQPVHFFEAMPEGRPKGKALVFNLLISEFLLVIDFLWSLMGLRGKLGESGQTDGLHALAGSPSLSFLMLLLLIPLVLSVGVYLDAWLTHLLLLLFRSAKKGFNETFRVMCYSAAPTVLSAVPVAGQILSPVILIWYMALQAIGLKKAHQGAYTQTLAAIFIKWSLYLFLILAMLQNFAPGR